MLFVPKGVRAVVRSVLLQFVLTPQMSYLIGITYLTECNEGYQMLQAPRVPLSFRLE
jgi:hypothetical protein